VKSNNDGFGFASGGASIYRLIPGIPKALANNGRNDSRHETTHRFYPPLNSKSEKLF
jgi:hypothetical protein